MATLSQTNVSSLPTTRPTSSARSANHLVYDSFGNRISETNAAVDTLFGYTCREWDTDIDLQHNRARWYDPATGTWISKDPIEFAAGDANLYRYVENNTLQFVDPSGLDNLWNPFSWGDDRENTG